MNNIDLFTTISQRNGVNLIISFDANFQKNLDAFRNATSNPRTLNGIDYPAVYLTDNDYGGLTIQYNTNKCLRLIVNLEFYYVYGFFLDDGNVYAFTDSNPEDNCYQLLTDFGFTCTKIPYGDSYTDISRQLKNDRFYDLQQTTVKLAQITTALDTICDTSINFEDKAESILVAFWSLVEGIRFAGISNVVNNLIQEKPSDFIYDYFYELAEIWARISLIAAYEKTKNPDIAVYDLHRID